jgi:hypothetical protein
VGVVTGGAPPPGGTVGGFRGSLPPGERAGALLGDVPVGTPVFTLPTPAPSGARLGDPRPADIAGRVQDQGRQFLIEGDYGDGEARLRSSVSIHEKASGPKSPPVVESLEQNAGVLRIWNRGAAATEMETQAQTIRKGQEQSVTPAAPADPLALPPTSSPFTP